MCLPKISITVTPDLAVSCFHWHYFFNESITLVIHFVIHQAKIAKNEWFQLLKCEDFLLSLKTEYLKFSWMDKQFHDFIFHYSLRF